MPAAAGDAALAKGLALFNRIAADRGATALATLAADLVLPRSTLHRLAAALARAGLITRLSPGRYTVGLPVAEALHGATGPAHLAELCRPALRRLAHDCRATAHLGVMENDMVTYLVKEVAGDSRAAAFTRENAQLEAYCSGIGKVLLSWLPAADRARYLAAGPFVALTAQTITDPASLARHLATVRAQNFARDDGEISADLYCLAVPLWTTPPVTAAISLSFPRHAGSAAEDQTDLAALHHCAATLALKLGKVGAAIGRSSPSPAGHSAARRSSPAPEPHRAPPSARRRA